MSKSRFSEQKSTEDFPCINTVEFFFWLQIVKKGRFLMENRHMNLKLYQKMQFFTKKSLPLDYVQFTT